MPLYDLFLLLDPGAPTDRHETILRDVQSLLESDGKLVGAHDWGSRRMTFEIDHRPDAAYHLFQFEAESGGELLNRVDHALKITDGVLRHRIIRLKDGSPPPPMPRQEGRPYSADGEAPAEAPAADPAAAPAADPAVAPATDPAAAPATDPAAAPADTATTEPSPVTEAAPAADDAAAEPVEAPADPEPASEPVETAAPDASSLPAEADRADAEPETPQS